MACRTAAIGTGNGSKRPMRGGRVDEEEEEMEEYQFCRLLADQPTAFGVSCCREMN